MTDRELLERAQQGDDEAWRSLYRRLTPVIWATALARTADRSGAEEVMAESFLALVRQLDQIEADTFHLHGWLYRVVRNKATDWRRRRISQSQAMRGLARQPRSEARDDPSAGAMLEEQNAAVIEALDAVSEAGRTALQLKYCEGLSVREIAERLEVTEKAAESLLFRARNEFRQKYEQRSKRGDMPRSPFCVASEPFIEPFKE